MSYVFDNSASVAFAIMISIFAVSVNFLWQRREFRLQYEWDMVIENNHWLNSFTRSIILSLFFFQTDFAEETETLRPDFERRVEKTIVNKVTDKVEPYVPTYKRFLYYTYVEFFN